MDPTLTRLFNDYDGGKISRRHLLQALGVAAVAAPLTAAFGQGRCGSGRAGTAACDTVPMKAPFEPTGWKTVYMDHFSLQVEDYKKEAGYYAALMGWKVRSDDGTKAVMDMGDDAGSVIIRGGYVAPPPPPPRPAGDTAGGRGGRGGGAGAAGGGGAGGRGGQGGPPRAPLRGVWDNMCWGIDNWDAKKVEAELKKRGLDPIADNDGKDFQSFHVKDPDGFDLQISNGNRKNRRQGAPKGPAPTMPFESTGWKTVWLDHISFAVGNYKESAAFYQALLGWTPTGDEGSQNECQIGDLGNVIIRGGGPGTPLPTPRRAVINHIAFGIAPFDPDEVKGALEKRGLTAREDTGGKGDIHTEAAQYKSYHTTTPAGWDLQISNATKDRRMIR